MSSSSSTPPAEAGGAAHRAARRDLLSRLVPWGLIGAWCLLVGFGICALLDPPWLQELARPGKKTEVAWYVDWGDKHVRDGDFARAIHWYGRALQIDPRSSRAAVNAAVALGRLDRVEEGARILDALLKSGVPQRVMILYNLAELHFRHKDYDRALPWYEQALAEGAWPQLVYSRLGDIHLKREDFVRARDTLRQAARLWTSPLTHYRNMLLSASEATDEEEDWVLAVRAKLKAGVSEADLAGYDVALHRQQMERDSELGWILGKLGYAEAKLGERQAAIEHLQRSLAIWPDSPRAEQLQALLHRLQGGR